MFVRRTKGRGHYNIRAIFHSTNNRSVTLQIFTLWKKNKSILLHSFAGKRKTININHILPNPSEIVFLAAFVILISQHQWTNCQTKHEQFSKRRRRTDVSFGFHWNTSFHANNMFLNGNEIADEVALNFSNFKVIFCISL